MVDDSVKIPLSMSDSSSAAAPYSGRAAIYYEADGYRTDRAKLMGRQAAGESFLRAALNGLGDNEPIYGFGPDRANAVDAFRAHIQELRPNTLMGWIPASQWHKLREVGNLHMPQPNFSAQANLRLRTGATAYSLTGVTHTMSSAAAMRGVCELMHAPVMPWDALILTSRAVGEVVKQLFESERDYLRWRFGPELKMTLPQLPIIPLGIHTSDYHFTESERFSARAALQLEEEDIAIMFLGRLSFHAKAHPFALYKALQDLAAERTSGKITLIMSGWFANSAIEQAFKRGAEAYAPNVRVLFLDARKATVRNQSYAASDIFVSLSDNIQESFGLTPIEGMAAGLPVIVSDWNGYRNSVRHGTDGFRVATYQPEGGSGTGLAAAFESGLDNYDNYCGLACQLTAIDIGDLTSFLETLIQNPDLRKTMGEAARKRAQEEYDWKIVYQRYQDLWGELDRIRDQAQKSTNWQHRLSRAPSHAPESPDPFTLFQQFPTVNLGPAHRFSWVGPPANMVEATHQSLIKDPLFSYAQRIFPPSDSIALLAEEFTKTSTEAGDSADHSAKPLTLAGADIARILGEPQLRSLHAIAHLLKIGWLQLESDDTSAL